MSLEKFQGETDKCTITAVSIGPIRELIPAEHHKAWSQYDVEGGVAKLDRDHYIVTYDNEGYLRTEYFIVPNSKRGYMKSNIKTVLEKNKLGPFPLEWVGCTVLVEYDRNGYASISK